MASKPARLTLDDFRAANRQATAKCSLGAFLATLPRDDAAAVCAALDDRSIQHTAIVRVLQRRGYAHGLNAIRRHRADGCAHCATGAA